MNRTALLFLSGLLAASGMVAAPQAGVSETVGPRSALGQVFEDRVASVPVHRDRVFVFRATPRVNGEERVQVWGRVRKAARAKGEFATLDLVERSHSSDIVRTVRIRNGRFNFSFRASEEPLVRTYELWANRHRGTVKSGAFKVAMNLDQPAGDATDWTWVTPVQLRFDPCTPVTWRLHRERELPSARPDSIEAFRRLSVATGMTFTDVTDQPAASAMIDIWFKTEAEQPRFASSVTGLAWVDGMDYDSAGKVWATHGVVELDAGAVNLTPGWEQGRLGNVGALITHEVSHVLGLGHAESRLQTMAPTLSPANRFLGAGDLAGLNALGMNGGCAAQS